MSAVMVIEDLNLLFIVFCGTKALILLCMHACMRQLGCATVWLILTSVLFDDARLSIVTAQGQPLVQYRGNQQSECADARMRD